MYILLIYSQAADFDGDQLAEMFNTFLWLWAFPAVGALVGIVEFILSIVSYSIVCCCRPSALSEVSQCWSLM